MIPAFLMGRTGRAIAIAVVLVAALAGFAKWQRLDAVSEYKAKAEAARIEHKLNAERNRHEIDNLSDDDLLLRLLGRMQPETTGRTVQGRGDLPANQGGNGSLSCANGSSPC